MLTKNELGEKILRKLYLEDQLSILKISELMETNYKAVRLRLKELGILRNKSEAAKIAIKPPISEEGKKNKSLAKLKAWADPNSSYNSPEFRIKKSESSRESRLLTLSDPEKKRQWLEAIKRK